MDAYTEMVDRVNELSLVSASSFRIARTVSYVNTQTFFKIDRSFRNMILDISVS